MTSTNSKKPNFLVVVADDLGFSDISPYGGEIDTPNLARLAREGLRMTDFHTAPMCSPTRSMLFSGTDSHIAGLGNMQELMREAPELYKGRKGYEGYLNFDVAALPEILSDNGYFTTMSGKWHLGLKREVAPCSRGFKKSFTFLGGAHNHYNNEPQLENRLPRVPSLVGDNLYMDGDTFLNRKADLPKDFYSTKTFTDRLLGFLGDRDEEDKKQPFFAFLAYTAPHWPLQAEPEVVEKYRGKYNDGPNALQNRRLAALQKLKLVPYGVEPAPMVDMETPPWEKLSPEEKTRSCRAMEIFAAMVDQIDHHLGRVLDYLRSTNELDNTFVMFISDNGAEGHILEATPLFEEQSFAEVVRRHYDNSLDNMGRGDSFVWYGPRWASAATAPSRGFKAWATEGGIRCPCILRYPSGISHPQGSISHSFTTVVDIMPTLLDLAGIQHPAPSFRGRKVAKMRGKSWVPHLSGLKEDIYDPETEPFSCELFGSSAVRKGQWKAVCQAPPKGSGHWELYDLSKDPGEIHDLSTQKPELMQELISHYDTFYQESGQFDASFAIRLAEKRAAEVRAKFRGLAGDGLYYA